MLGVYLILAIVVGGLGLVASGVLGRSQYGAALAVAERELGATQSDLSVAGKYRGLDAYFGTGLVAKGDCTWVRMTRTDAAPLSFSLTWRLPSSEQPVPPLRDVSAIGASTIIAAEYERGGAPGDLVGRLLDDADHAALVRLGLSRLTIEDGKVDLELPAIKDPALVPVALEVAAGIATRADRLHAELEAALTRGGPFREGPDAEAIRTHRARQAAEVQAFRSRAVVQK